MEMLSKRMNRKQLKWSLSAIYTMSLEHAVVQEIT